MAKGEPQLGPRSIAKKVKEICKNYATGEFTIENCCNNAGVAYRTFLNWFQTYRNFKEEVPEKWQYFAELADLWENSREAVGNLKKTELITAAESSLLKKVKGYDYEETTTEVKERIDADGTKIMIPVGMKRTKKQVVPSDSAIQFALRTLKPEVYGDRSVVTNVNLNTNKYDDMSLDEIEAEIHRLKQND